MVQNSLTEKLPINKINETVKVCKTSLFAGVYFECMEH